MDQTGAWWGGGEPPLSAGAEPRAGATISQLRHIVIKICTAGAERQCLEPESVGFCQECCCSLRSNFFPWVKVRSGFQPELRRDCQLHWSQETSPHPPAPWLLTLTALSLPSSLKSWNFITSAIMKPFSKSVWIFPAACGALVPFCHGEGRERTNELFCRRWITACRRQGVWWGR